MTATKTPVYEAWPRCPETENYFKTLFQAFSAHNPSLQKFSQRLFEVAGVSILNLIDHWTLPTTEAIQKELTDIGMVSRIQDEETVWRHPTGRFPQVRIGTPTEPVRLAIAVESLQDFAEANDLPFPGQHGDTDSGYVEVRYPLTTNELAVIVRQGYAGFQPGSLTAQEARTLQAVRTKLDNRNRNPDSGDTVGETQTLLTSLAEEIERDRLVDEFFASERRYYMTRNAAARKQYQRQQQLGIGWANHDHHTYRCSRSIFRSVLQTWVWLGFEPREKFYAGADAGWGAQVLEHPVSKVVLFCDVDMAPEELALDYLEVSLPPLPTLGTIGLWCGLHDDSIGCAGLHHLEAEFDFAQNEALFVADKFQVMKPFTDLPMLKQAFTAAEIWKVEPHRAKRLLEQGYITQAQFEKFLSDGAPGSHLEILQRWEGYKGFNKTGISNIIHDTDGRLYHQPSESQDHA